jgi:hypothetical protein
MGEGYRPLARSAALLVEEIGDELLVFDSERNRAHSLNSTAAAVWRACDGTRDHDTLAEQCGIDHATLVLALERLRAAHLVDGAQAPSEGVSRRLMIRRSLTAGAALGVAIPVIRSITAPSAAMAASNGRVKGKAGQACSRSSQCSSAYSICNGQMHSCQRGNGASCSHTSSCVHLASFTSVCQLGTCGRCIHMGSSAPSCPASHPFCNSAGLCV